MKDKKKIEWAIVAGRSPYASSGKLNFVKTSKCRVCKRPLTWGDRTYEFDHKDNNPANNAQTNCYLVCRNCHGKATVTKKRKIKGMFGRTVGYETIKKKVGYKKPKKTKRVAIRGIFGNVIGYRTVKVRKPKATKKKTTTKKTKRKTKPKKTTRKKKATKTRKKKR